MTYGDGGTMTRAELAERAAHDQQQCRRACADKLVERCEEIIEALVAAKDDPKCVGLEQFIDGHGALVVGMEKEVRELKATAK